MTGQEAEMPDLTGTGFGYCDFYGTDGDTTKPISGREADRTV